MFKSFSNISLIVASLSLSACATPITSAPHGSSAEIAIEAAKQRDFAYKIAVDDIYNNSRKIQQLSYPIVKNSTILCKNHTIHDYGIRVWHQDMLPKKYRDMAHKLYGLDDQINVYMTVGGSPAAKAGMNRGDIILAVNNTGFTPGSSAIKEYQNTLKKNKNKTVKFTIKRDQKTLTYNVKPDTVCNSPIVYQYNEKSINAFADGKQMYLTKGMMDFVKSDNELALIISHELGHNVMDHISKKKQNAAAGTFVGLLLDVAVVAAGGYNPNMSQSFANIGLSAYSVEFEQEADYVGLYIMARANQDTVNAEMLWRRMSAEVSPRGISVRTTHPAHAERFISIKKANEEIALKKSKGQALVPNIDPEKLTRSQPPENKRGKKLND